MRVFSLSHLSNCAGSTVQSMKTLLILGAGTAGTILANKMVGTVPQGWQVLVVDKDDHHHYQPGFLFLPVGMMPERRITKSRRAQLKPEVIYQETTVRGVDTESKTVSTSDGDIAYDLLVIATGTGPRPELVDGLNDERIWRKAAHEFYTKEGSVALRDALATFTGGKILIHVAEMPIKCPVAPLEIALLVEDFFRKRRIRHKVDITYVTPLDGAFTKPVASRELSNLLEDRSIRLVADFAVESVNPISQHLTSYDGRSLPFDLLIEVPPHTGADFLIGNPLTDDQGFVKVDKHTLQSVTEPNVFAVGDATNAPTSKAGAVAHFEIDKLVENIQQVMAGQEPTHKFDGHANCFVESGRGKAMLLDFNYETQPLTGKFPVPVVGPMTLLGESRINHLGKLAFEFVYWKALLPGKKIPLSADMSLVGKNQE